MVRLRHTLLNVFVYLHVYTWRHNRKYKKIKLWKLRNVSIFSFHKFHTREIGRAGGKATRVSGKESLIKLKLNLYRYRCTSDPLICIFYRRIRFMHEPQKLRRGNFPSKRSDDTIKYSSHSINKHTARETISQSSLRDTDHRRPKVHAATL